jgi:hypothetical protein
MSYRHATKPTANQTLASAQTCIFRVENVLNAYVNYEHILSRAIHHTSEVSLLLQKVTAICDLQKQSTFPLFVYVYIT